MTSRFKGFGAFGSKRTSSGNNNSNTTSTRNGLTPPPAQGGLQQGNYSSTSLAPSPPTNGSVHTPHGSTSSTTSLPMQNPSGLGRPPSYTYNPNAPRAASPRPPTQMAGHPPPINTGGYSQAHPAMQGGGAQPPGYGGGYGHHAPPQSMAQYGGRGQAVEVEGAGRSKAQLIVGIDFVSDCRLGHGRLLMLMSLGYHIFRGRFRLCDQHGSKRGHHY